MHRCAMHKIEMTMEDNRKLLDWLFAERKIALQRGKLFDTCPPAPPPDLAWDRVEGMLLGLAIGDSLGNTTEGQLPDERSDDYGEIRDYLPHHSAGGRSVGLPSDDTQLAFWTLEQLIEDRGLVPDHLAQRFCRQRVFGIGNTVAEFIHNYRYLKRPWHEAGPASAGNGALMRIAPVLIPHLRNPAPTLWADTALAAMITHNDPASTGSCLALVSLLWEALRATTPPQPDWWVNTFCEVLRPLEGESHYRAHGRDVTYEGPLWRFTATRVREAFEAELPVATACDGWYSGAYLLETVPSVLYILGRCAHDPEEAIVRAVNDTWDNDTVAAIVGAVVGVLHGRSRLPQRWIDSLSGRTAEADDGRVFELIAAVHEIWW
jgi:ADP-ribosyl-[dinitrogen reductase] hydrolase